MEPTISIASPFKRHDLPSLFFWVDRLREQIADDTFPPTVDAFMEELTPKLGTPDFLTFSIHHEGRLAGYFEAQFHEADTPNLSGALRVIAEARVIFKREFWKLQRTRRAMNMCLREIFDDGCETLFLPVFAKNRGLREVFKSVGATDIGEIEPRTQNGAPVETRMYAVSAVEWARQHREFAEPEAPVEEAETVEV